MGLRAVLIFFAVFANPECAWWCETLVKPSGLALQGVGLACLLLLLLVMHPALSNPAAGTALNGLWFVVIFFFIGVARMQASGVRLLLSPGNPRGIF